MYVQIKYPFCSFNTARQISVKSCTNSANDLMPIMRYLNAKTVKLIKIAIKINFCLCYIFFD